MCKLLSTLIGFMLLISITAQETGDWKKLPGNFNYKSNGVSCEIASNGWIRKLTADNTLLIESSCLHGRYKILKDKKHDNRFFQAFERKYPLTLKKISENSYIVKKRLFALIRIIHLK